MPDDRPRRCRPPAAGDPGEGIPLLSLRLAARDTAVRAALLQLDAACGAAGLGAEDAATAQIVLAEVLNNVVEHACAADAPIGVAIRLVPGALSVTVCDDGAAMPGLVLPPGRAPDLETPDLPEGGYGWYLIRLLAEGLCYQRDEGGNRLRFRLPLGRGAQQSGHAAGTVVHPGTMPE
jgi:serine/threonine-protein kinase RsbW